MAHHRRVRLAVLLSTSLAGLSVLPSRAEESSVTLEEITVTARRRDEPLKNVPFSVDVTTREQMEARGITDGASALKDVAGAGLETFGDRSMSFMSMRGVGPILSPLSQDDSSVVTFVDGAPLGLSASNGAYLDLERIEIMKGPQSVLFGRNTSGGAINLIPVQPSEKREGHITGELGLDGQRKIEGAVGGAIVPGFLAARLALRATGIDGYVPNAYGPTLGTDQTYAGRASFLFTPSETTRWLLTLSGGHDRLNPPYYIVKTDQDVLKAGQGASLERGDTAQMQSKLEHDFDSFTVTSQTSYFKKSVHFNYVLDYYLAGALSGRPAAGFSPYDQNYYDRKLDEERFTQEVRVNSSADAAIPWLAGLAYYRDASDWNSAYNMALYGPFAAAARDVYHGTTDGKSVFGEVTVPVFDKLKLTTGARYTFEDKTFSADYRTNGASGTVPAFAENGSLSDNFWTGRASLAYEWDANLTTYGTVARGYKSGGFGSFNSAIGFGIPRTPYRASTVLSYEVGARARVMNQLSLTTALFYNDIAKEQIMAFDAQTGQNSSLNVDATSYGGEIGASWDIDGHWTLDSGAAYTFSRLRNVGTDLANLQPGLKDGNQLPLTPHWTARSAVTYRAGLDEVGLSDLAAATGARDLSARLAYNFIGDRFGEAANAAHLDPVHLLSARLSLTNGKGDWEVYAFGDNLLDKHYVVMANPYGTDVATGQTLYGATYARGLTAGLGATFHF